MVYLWYNIHTSKKGEIFKQLRIKLNVSQCTQNPKRKILRKEKLFR